MNLLEKIIASKRKAVEDQRALYPVKLLEKSIYFNSECVSLKKYLLRPDKSGIIAEYKRKSPSKGMINAYAPVERTTIGYMQAGASALSILTDAEFFGGKNEDLTLARKFNYCPILRKDFVLDEYQVIESRSIGADAILLLANVLSAKEIKTFSQLAASLGMEVLLEVRNSKEINSCNEKISCIGVNNRDLRDFNVDVGTSLKLAKQLPSSCARISESGIDSSETILKLKREGYNGFLIGESFMRSSRPEKACARLVRELQDIPPMAGR